MHAEYTLELEEQIQKWAFNLLDQNRIAHVRGVADTVDKLAVMYAPDMRNMIRIAAWIHDVAKGWADKDLLQYAIDNSLPITQAERYISFPLHGLVSYHLASREFGLNDMTLESACTLHTTGGEQMNVTDKILFLGDLIEPTRNFPNVDHIRLQAEENLDKAVLLAADITLEYLIAGKKYIDPRTWELRNSLIKAGINYNRL